MNIQSSETPECPSARVPEDPRTRGRVIDLSCDLGEASTTDEQAIEDALWPLISAANVACGGHAGDEESMRHAVDQARRFGVKLGAHPSYPDREHFGRKSMDLPAETLRSVFEEQLGRLKEIADRNGLTLERVKPHGALYNDLHHDRELAAVVVEAIQNVSSEIAVTASPGSQFCTVAEVRGLRVVAEAFGDRRYRLDGSLVPRSEADSLLLDIEEAASQAILLAEEHRVVARDGTSIPVEFDTLCIHGDMPGSVERLKAIREGLLKAGFRLA